MKSKVVLFSATLDADRSRLLSVYAGLILYQYHLLQTP